MADDKKPQRKSRARPKKTLLHTKGSKECMTEQQREEFFRLVSACMYPAEAARKLGFTPQAISMRKKRDPEFAQQLQEAETSAELRLLANVQKAGLKDWRASMALLERRFKERWSRPEIQAQMNVSNVDAEQLAQAIHAGLAAIAKKHANFDAPDVDAQAET